MKVVWHRNRGCSKKNVGRAHTAVGTEHGRGLSVLFSSFFFFFQQREGDAEQEGEREKEKIKKKRGKKRTKDGKTL